MTSLQKSAAVLQREVKREVRSSFVALEAATWLQRSGFPKMFREIFPKTFPCFVRSTSRAMRTVTDCHGRRTQSLTRLHWYGAYVLSNLFVISPWILLILNMIANIYGIKSGWKCFMNISINFAIKITDSDHWYNIRYEPWFFLRVWRWQTVAITLDVYEPVWM